MTSGGPTFAAGRYGRAPVTARSCGAAPARAGLLFVVVCAGLGGCARPVAHAPPIATPAVAVHAAIELEPLDLSPDGEARLLVRLRYTAADGARVHIPPGGHVDVFASRGSVAWQPRAQYGDPAAIVRLTEPGPLALRVASDISRVPHVLRAATDTRAWRLPSVTARALGPHSVVVGWFPRVHAGKVRVVRTAADGTRTAFAPLAAPASSWCDPTVRPGAEYTYEVRRPGAGRIEVGVGVPVELPRSTPAAIAGKAMWLSFDDGTEWNVEAMLAQAQRAGLHAVELRMAYGEFDEVAPARRALIDRFIDGAARRGIRILAWTVPRAATFEDLAASVRAAAYRTAAGNGPRGVAVDLERGADFLGSGGAAYAALAAYPRRLRAALGPHVLIVATVEDPHIETLSNADVPYAAIAASADVLQPMVYWRARRAGASIAGMRAELSASYARTRELAGRAIPIDIGGQSASLGNRYGAPPPAEVVASIDTARALGALGEAFFDWDGTSAAQWAAIGGVVFPGPGDPARADAGRRGGRAEASVNAAGVIAMRARGTR